MIRSAVWLPVVTLLLPLVAAAQVWNLPAELSARNTALSFVLDSGHGRIAGSAGSSGRLWLADPRDHQSIRGRITVPAREIRATDPADTLRLMTLLAAVGSAELLLDIRRVTDLCAPAELRAGRGCRGLLHGEAILGALRHEVELPFELRAEGGRFRLSGAAAVEVPRAEPFSPMALLGALIRSVQVRWSCLI